MLARRAQLTFTERVIDIGCGTGAALVPASTAAGWILGTDPSVGMLEHVPWPVPLLATDAQALALRDASFDVAMAGFALHFVADAAAAVAEVARVLRPGGRFVVSLPDAEIPACGQVKGRWAQELGLPPRRPWPASWMDDLLSAAGFEQVEPSADSHTFSFPTGGDYIAWNLSHAGRALFEAVPDDRRAAFERDLVEAAESAREGDGIPMHATARFWSAVKPTAPVVRVM